MTKNRYVEIHSREADIYDKQAKDFNYYGHDVLFGMSYQFMKKGESILDLGIGTGLSTIWHAAAGLEVTGMDASGEMLRICKAKNFARQLVEHDLNATPYPFDDVSFNHINSCGVFHFFESLDMLFAEISRIHKSGGIFALSFGSLDNMKHSAEYKKGADILSLPTAWGVNIWFHSIDYIEKLAAKHGYSVMKKQKLLVSGGSPEAEELPFVAMILKK